jgi:hypothetical protein
MGNVQLGPEVRVHRMNDPGRYRASFTLDKMKLMYVQIRTWAADPRFLVRKPQSAGLAAPLAFSFDFSLLYHVLVLAVQIAFFPPFNFGETCASRSWI